MIGASKKLLQAAAGSLVLPTFLDLGFTVRSQTLTTLTGVNGRAWCAERDTSFGYTGYVWLWDSDSAGTGGAQGLVRASWNGSSFTQDSTISSGVISSQLGMADNGTHLLVCNSSNAVQKIEKSTGTVTTMPGISSSSNKQGILWDGTYFWIGSYTTPTTVYRMDDWTNSSTTYTSYTKPSWDGAQGRGAAYNFLTNEYYFSEATNVFTYTYDGGSLSFVSKSSTGGYTTSAEIDFIRQSTSYAWVVASDYNNDRLKPALAVPAVAPAPPTNPDIGNATYDSLSYTISGLSTPIDVNFKPDGTKMYILAAGSESVSEYDLSTAWDLSTAPSTASRSYSVATQAGDPYGFRFKSDGTKMYVVDTGDGAVYQYSLSTAWNVSTASYDSVSFSFSSQDSSSWGIEFSPDGTKMLMVGWSADTAYQYALSTAWDLSTASYSSVSLSLSAQDGSNIGMRFSPSGDALYVSGYNNDSIYEYTLAYSFNVSGASYSGTSLSVTTVASNPKGFAFKDDFTKMYILDLSTSKIYQYST